MDSKDRGTNNVLAGDSPSDAPITRVDPMERTLRPTHTELPEFEVGSIICDRYELLEILGQGGMGTVYRARDIIKDKVGDPKPYLAIKLLTGDFRHHPHAFEILQREARKTRELAHPNIVTVFDFDRDDGVVYLTMEQLSGAPLLEIIRQQTLEKLPLETRYRIIEQIAKGLAYAHQNGIVHSDLKPANLFVTERNTVKILDFGIARAANQELFQEPFDASQLGALTMSYASPEMIRQESPHPSDDIYALGIIICELLGEQHPFDRIDAASAMEDNLQPKLPAIKNPWLVKCILNSLAFERKNRIGDAAEFLRRFQQALFMPKIFFIASSLTALFTVVAISILLLIF